MTQQRNPKKWYAIRRSEPRATANGDDRAPRSAAEVLIYGDIGESWYENSVSAADFVKELSALVVDEITVRINSYGGSVPDGIAIHNAMRRHTATITVEVDGTAYSIASLIAMAGDVVRMADNAMLMIHAPWTYAAGNAVELREVADQLDSWAAAMTSSYARKSGDADAAAALLSDGKDHFFTAAEALAAGFVDEVADAMPLAAHAISTSAFIARLRQARDPVFPAAAAASFQPEKEITMSEKTVEKQPAAPIDNAALDQAVATARAETLAAERQRRVDIAQAFARFADREDVRALLRTCQDDTEMTVQAAKDRLLAQLARGMEPVAGQHVVTVEDEADKQRAAAENALLARAGLAPMDSSNPMRGYNLSELARAAADRAGYKTAGRQNMEFVGAAFTHSTSDFPTLLSSVASKAMLKGYEEAEETFQRWTNAGSASDFKVGQRVGLGMFGSLPKVGEGAEYSYGTIGDRGAPVMVATYGRLFSITRQAIINDDLDAFTRIPRLMGRAAIRTIGDLVYGVLTAGATFDGAALFAHARGNRTNSNGDGISTATVARARTDMALRELDDVPLNIPLRYLLVPRTLEGIALTVRDSDNAIPFNTQVEPNIVKGTFDVIADARLDADSTDAWYGIADPAVYDTIEVTYLNGQQSPTLEQKDGWNIDGVEFKVRMDAGVAPLEWRTMYKNDGTS